MEQPGLGVEFKTVLNLRVRKQGGPAGAPRGACSSRRTWFQPSPTTTVQGTCEPRPPWPGPGSGSSSCEARHLLLLGSPAPAKEGGRLPDRGLGGGGGPRRGSLRREERQQGGSEHSAGEGHPPLSKKRRPRCRRAIEWTAGSLCHWAAGSGGVTCARCR